MKVVRVYIHYITLYHTIPHYTTRYHTIPHDTTRYHTIPHDTTRYHTIPHDTTLYYTTPHDTTRYHTIPHYTTRYHTIGSEGGKDSDDGGKDEGDGEELDMDDILKGDKVKKWIEKWVDIKVEERLQLVLNNDMHTPLTLAAERIQKYLTKPRMTKAIEMLGFLIQSQKQASWIYGPVTHTLLDLSGIEQRYDLDNYTFSPHLLPTIDPPLDDLESQGGKRRLPSSWYLVAEKIYIILGFGTWKEYKAIYVKQYKDSLITARHKQMHAAIAWLCINDAQQGISLPDVTRIIQTKWERCGYQPFLVRGSIDLLITILMTLISFMVNSSTTSTPTNTEEYVLNFLFPVVVVIFLIMLYKESQNFLSGVSYASLRYTFDYIP